MSAILKAREQFNTLSYPKWKRVGSQEFKVPEEFKPASAEVTGIQEFKNLGGRIYKINSEDKDLDDVYYRKYDKTLDNFEEKTFGVDNKYLALAEGYFNTGHIINVPKSTEISGPLIVEYSVSDQDRFLNDLTYVHLEENASLDLVIKYSSNIESQQDLNDGYHNGLVKAFLSKNSRLNLSVVQIFDQKTVHINNVVSIQEDNAELNYVSVDLGGKVIVTDYSTFLEGTASRSYANTAYLGLNDMKLDLGYRSHHFGKQTDSLIETKGALLNKAKKIFRGDLKFYKGAKKATGKEGEYVLLLSEDVKSDAIPSLLCDEDDVSGEHAASAGQVSADSLFYLMSRGFSEKEAKKLIIHGSFSKVIDLLPDEELRQLVDGILERRLVYEQSV